MRPRRGVAVPAAPVVLACALVAALAASACDRRGANAANTGAPASSGAGEHEQGDARVVESAPPEDPRAAELWAHAAEGDADDLARLAAHVGADGLVEAWGVPPRRLPALRALAFSDDFSELPFLARIATSGTDDEAAAALETVALLAAEPRRATDPEDALEIHDGCIALLVLAKDVTRPAARRARAVSALRMLGSRGCAPASVVPTELDTR